MDSRYKIQPASDHVAKFHGDRSGELGECEAKQKKTSRAKHKPPELSFGRPIIIKIRLLKVNLRETVVLIGVSSCISFNAEWSWSWDLRS